MVTAQRPPGGGRFILLVAALVHVGLFIGAVHQRLVGLEQGAPSDVTCEGIFIGPCNDGAGYYAWLRSSLVDGDWQFDNEFDEHNKPLNLPTPTGRTPLGRRLNQWSVGPAILWSVTVAPLHALLVATDGAGTWPADGYSLPYQITLGATTLALSILTLYITAAVCRHFASPCGAALAAACITLGTPLVYYGSLETSMAHGPASAVLAVYLWVWLRGLGSYRLVRWLALGALLGVTATMRWQLATYALIPAGEMAWWVIRERKFSRACACTAAAAVGALIGFAPQLIAWKVTCGQWVANPHPLAHHWFVPDFSHVLFATDRGLFYWSPIALVGLVGLVGRAAVRGGAADRGVPVRRCAALLGLGFAAQAYVLASVHGTGVFLGSAFGHRFLTESCVPLAAGLAVLLDRRSTAVRFGVGGACASLVVWNLLMVIGYTVAELPPGAGLCPADLFAAVERVLDRPWRGWTQKPSFKTFIKQITSKETIVENGWRSLAFIASASVWWSAVKGYRAPDVPAVTATDVPAPKMPPERSERAAA